MSQGGDQKVTSHPQKVTRHPARCVPDLGYSRFGPTGCGTGRQVHLDHPRRHCRLRRPGAGDALTWASCQNMLIKVLKS